MHFGTFKLFHSSLLFYISMLCHNRNNMPLDDEAAVTVPNNDLEDLNAEAYGKTAYFAKCLNALMIT